MSSEQPKDDKCPRKHEDKQYAIWHALRASLTEEQVRAMRYIIMKRGHLPL